MILKFVFQFVAGWLIFMLVLFECFLQINDWWSEHDGRFWYRWCVWTFDLILCWIALRVCYRYWILNWAEVCYIWWLFIRCCLIFVWFDRWKSLPVFPIHCFDLWLDFDIALLRRLYTSILILAQNRFTLLLFQFWWRMNHDKFTLYIFVRICTFSSFAMVSASRWILIASGLWHHYDVWLRCLLFHRVADSGVAVSWFLDVVEWDWKFTLTFNQFCFEVDGFIYWFIQIWCLWERLSPICRRPYNAWYINNNIWRRNSTVFLFSVPCSISLLPLQSRKHRQRRARTLVAVQICVDVSVFNEFWEHVLIPLFFISLLQAKEVWTLGHDEGLEVWLCLRWFVFFGNAGSWQFGSRFDFAKFKFGFWKLSSIAHILILNLWWCKQKFLWI